MLQELNIASRANRVRRYSGMEHASPAKNRELVTAMETAGSHRWFSRDTEIYAEKERAEYLYMLVSGAVRAYKVVMDGRRLISAFYMPGDIFDLEASKNHVLSTEAIVNSDALLVRRDAIMTLAARDPELMQQLWTSCTQELRRSQEHMLLLNRYAEERIASFLLEMSRRTNSTSVHLPMSRQDIGDYLGLTSETISRMLTKLESSGAIHLPTCKQIALRNRAKLEQLVI